MPKRDHIIFKGSNTLRKITIRIDTYGIYLLFWEQEDMKAGITYQYPEWYQRIKNGNLAAIHIKPGFSIFSW